MPAGCKNPYAKNYNPAANPDDYSCIYMLKNQTNCHWFEDLPPEDGLSNSFTMSYSILGQAWVFFHDYFPDLYIHTRSQLYNVKNSEIYEHHKGVPGSYHQSALLPKKAFFIDVVFQADKNILLETVNWMTDFLSAQTDQPFQTLTHISIWNSHQHTGRIDLNKSQQFKELTTRNTKGEWVFNDFRNVLIAKGVPFIQSLFNDYAVISAQVNNDLAWYQKELLIDKWFCVRFEFDNSLNNQVILHDTTIQAIKSDR